jgi:periplasmic protein CpxP/Spy
MRTSFRQTVITTTAIIGLSAFAAAAAPPVAGDPATNRQPATTSAPPVTQVQANTGRNMAGKIEQRITDLHARLLISPAQQPQWDRFSQVMRDNARGMDETFQQRVQKVAGMTAPENMQSYARVANDHARDVQNLVPAFQALYDTMSASQKMTADQVFRDDAGRRDHARRS